MLNKPSSWVLMAAGVELMFAFYKKRELLPLAGTLLRERGLNIVGHSVVPRPQLHPVLDL